MRNKKVARWAAALLAAVMVVGACPVTEPLFTSEVKAAQISYQDTSKKTLSVDCAAEENAWPAVNFAVSEASNVTLPVGTEIACDVELKNTNAEYTKVYLEAKVGWTALGDQNKVFANTAFNESKMKFCITTETEVTLNPSGGAQGINMQSCSGNLGSCDYTGDIEFSNLTITLPEQTGGADDRFTIYNPQSDNPVLDVTDDNYKSWPWANFTTGLPEAITKGTTISYDVSIEADHSFTIMYLETAFNWNWLANRDVTPSDFTDNKLHIDVTYDKEAPLTISNGFQVKSGGYDAENSTDRTDYRGKITISNVTIKVPKGSEGTGGNTGDNPDPVTPGEGDDSDQTGLLPTTGNVINITDSQQITLPGAQNDQWPGKEFQTATKWKTIYAGTTIEYDLGVATSSFNKMYLETGFGWSNKVKADTLAPSSFKDNAMHVKVTYMGEPLAGMNSVVVKSGGTTDHTDYTGTLTISNMKITLAEPETPGEGTGETLEETVIFNGNEQIGQISQDENKLKSVYTSGNFNMKRVMPGGYFYVEYTADQKTTVNLALSDWQASNGGWYELVSTDSGQVEGKDKTFFAKYSYSACEYAIGGSNFSVIDAINVKVPASVVNLTAIKWFGPKYTEPSTSGGSYGGGSSDTASDASKDDKNNTESTVPAVEQNKSETVGGQEFFVTKSSAGGSAEVAFVETPASAKDTVIPDTVKINGMECKVVTVAAEAFKGDTKIETMKVGGNVVRIGDEAFAKCASLKEVTISESVTSIGMEAFSGCKNLKKIVITATGLNKIGKDALKGVNKNAVIEVPKGTLKAYKKLFTAKTGFKKTMKIVEV